VVENDTLEFKVQEWSHHPSVEAASAEDLEQEPWKYDFAGTLVTPTYNEEHEYTIVGTTPYGTFIRNGDVEMGLAINSIDFLQLYLEEKTQFQSRYVYFS
jgi:hypothetical protein